ncbi:MAG: tRNA pseudouridine(55) synthase TruB [Alphaproteobacteria bacterium]
MNKRRTLHGWINLYKPLGITSADAVHRVKRFIRPEKIGHAGTLDPMATGILPLALGEATKCVSLLMDAKKTYEFTLTFGERRTTDDAEGEVIATSDVIPTSDEIRAILPQFRGEIMQIPPIYSAIKQAGERAYALARAGEVVHLAARPVRIDALELLNINENKAEFRAIVGKGTYIRSLGRDMALTLGSQGYISRLHRASVGLFRENDAISLDFLENSAHSPADFVGGNPAWLLPTERVLDDIPAVAIEDSQWQSLRHGHGFRPVTPTPPAAMIGVLYRGQLVALAESDGASIQPKRMLNVIQ